jgi:succinate-semialdehyde dehydrogenase/glutarate-semialdehyde dehydrogenase
VPYISVNPATGEKIAEYPNPTAAELDAALKRSAAGFAAWRRASYDERATHMVRAAELLEAEAPTVAELMTSEMGKTFAAAKGEVAKCAMTMRYYAEHAEAMLEPESISSPARRSGIRYEPLGAVFAVMPWNFPLWQCVRFAAPSLMAGNVAILKHASNVGGCAAYLEGLFARSGMPAGCFVNLYLDHDDVPGVIADDRVAAVTLTGSERAGRTIAGLAGQSLKKCVMELGGSDAFIVGSSADLAATVPMAVTARVQNNGQSCIAAKRFVVVRERAAEFVELFSDQMAAVVVGDPMAPATVVGPIVSSAQREELAGQVADSVSRGATATTGGNSVEGPGFYYRPTVLVDVPEDSRAGREELFGPVAVVRVARDLGDAISIANETPWGLGASIWASDEAEIDAAIYGVEAGMVFANAIVASTPELPFGGIKNSGYGRELSTVGIREFTNVKTFYVA